MASAVRSLGELRLCLLLLVHEACLAARLNLISRLPGQSSVILRTVIKTSTFIMYIQPLQCHTRPFQVEDTVYVTFLVAKPVLASVQVEHHQSANGK